MYHFICPNMDLSSIIYSNFTSNKQTIHFSFVTFFFTMGAVDVKNEESIRKRKSVKSDNPKRQDIRIDEDIDEIKKVR